MSEDSLTWNGCYERKTKEMITYFGNNYDVNDIQSICVKGKFNKRVEIFKLLGVDIRGDLLWTFMLRTCMLYLLFDTHR